MSGARHPLGAQRGMSGHSAYHGDSSRVTPRTHSELSGGQGGVADLKSATRAAPNESSFAYFKSFVPSFVATKVVEDAALGRLTKEKSAACTDAVYQDAVIYLVDISGFSKLADRFCQNQEGIDKFSGIVNSLVSEIVEHVNSWGGDIVRFVGDCVIVVWKAEELRLMPGIVHKAVQCALELELLLGTFVVPCQRQSYEDVAEMGVGAPEEWGMSERHYRELAELLKGVSVLGRMNKKAIKELWQHNKLERHAKGDLITFSDLYDLERTVFIVHSGVVDCSAKGTTMQTSQHLSRLGIMQEGHIFTFRSLLDKHGLGQSGHRVSLFARADCVISQVKADVLESITGKTLSQLLEATLDTPQGNPQGSNIILRVHQAISCGKAWFAHVGGEALNEALGPRREFLVLGDPILEASDALVDAAAGDLVVGKSCGSFLPSAYTYTETKQGHLKIISAGPHELRADVMRPPSIGALPEDMSALMCTILRSYCHEGSRQLCGQAENLIHDIRHLSVGFFKLDMNLQNPTRKTLESIDAAFATIQGSVQRNNGTILQFVQDDKGLIVVACFGYAPFSQHAADPLRATLATMKIQLGLFELGVPVSIGVTTGAAFVGFAGNDRRRQQCVMGSTVNMAASLMCSSKSTILVDLETKTEASVSVQFKELPSIRAKGRAEPMRVFRPVRMLSEREILNKVVDIAKSSNIFASIEKAMPLLQTLVSERKHKCTTKYVVQACKYLQEKLKTFDHLPQEEERRHLRSLTLSIAKTPSTINLFSSADVESLGSTELTYTQSLAKVALFISHANVFPKELAKEVFCKSFGIGLPVFENAFAQLRAEYLIRPMMPLEASLFAGTMANFCPDCKPWLCLGRKVYVHAHLLAAKDEDNFVFVKEGRNDVQKHCSQTIQVNKKAWNRISAEWYEREKNVDITAGIVQVLLALKYEDTVEKVHKGAKFDSEMAIKAAYYLASAAEAAEDAGSHKHAIDMLQRAFHFLENVQDWDGDQTKFVIIERIKRLRSDSSHGGRPPSPLSLPSPHASQTSSTSSDASTPLAGSPAPSSPASPSLWGIHSPSENLLNAINRRGSVSPLLVDLFVRHRASFPTRPRVLEVSSPSQDQELPATQRYRADARSPPSPADGLTAADCFKGHGSRSRPRPGGKGELEWGKISDQACQAWREPDKTRETCQKRESHYGKKVQEWSVSGSESRAIRRVLGRRVSLKSIEDELGDQWSPTVDG